MFDVKPIWKTQAYGLIYKYHYSKVMPKLNKYYIGCFDWDKLVWVITLWRWVRPLHTIKKLFPSLTSDNYYEIGKMCFKDEYPKNTESQFISLMISRVKQNTDIDLVFTWADWMLGKPWYVYQASNFLYWGYIWTDSYFWEDWEKIHPRMTNKIWGRPNFDLLQKMWRNHFKGKQFRYAFFVCWKKRKKKLLEETTVEWTREYPKDSELEWKMKMKHKRVKCTKPKHNSENIWFHLWVKWQKDLFGYSS